MVDKSVDARNADAQEVVCGDSTEQNTTNITPRETHRDDHPAASRSASH
jgi:hypothetical protein